MTGSANASAQEARAMPTTRVIKRNRTNNSLWLMCCTPCVTIVTGTTSVKETTLLSWTSQSSVRKCPEHMWGDEAADESGKVVP